MLNWQELTRTDGATPLHRLDPRVKIATLLITGMVVILLDNPWLLAAYVAAGLAGMLAARLELLKLKVVAVVILMGLWGAVFSQALFYEQVPRTAIFTLISPEMPVLGKLTQGLYVYQEGVVYGLRQGLRMAAMTSLGLLACWTTETRLLLLGLVRMRLPYSLAFMTVTAVRFIPVMMQETMQVITASRMRGGSRLSIRLLTPILANCLRRAGTLAVAVESRAFRSSHCRTYLEELRLLAAEKVFLAGYLAAAAAIAAGKTSLILYHYGFYYSSALRPVYEFATNYL
ncbi:energy-coupling factor transporter transmembrane component T family protein [Methylomusa anaerophila]|uniref:Putative HMP/thiamine permease protein YkoC n=1 Tax=Methylomusa anaerophila TaxID=1930071 RepID=A0A348AEC0_9FIRM|nr:energy-coupling factor transporter transmembrane component T [Methylomusa anaerophila]BBB89418.1 putative HMP/thiamine permease protein YkoC [Methylomusa anaerophila]